MKKGIKAQGMTFSGNANVSASYRQQKKPRHAGTFRLSSTTTGQPRCVQMPEPAVRGRPGLNEPKWSGRAAAVAAQATRKSVYFRGRSKNRTRPPPFNPDIRIPFLTRWFRFKFGVRCGAEAADKDQRGVKWPVSVRPSLGSTLRRWWCVPAAPEPACLPAQPYEWSRLSAEKRKKKKSSTSSGR